MAETQNAGNESELEPEIEEEGGSQEPSQPKEKEDECPKCETGAPAWMATFADMATLLMAFFVLILSFSSVNVPKFEQVAGSLKLAFGIKRVVAKVSIPMAETLIVSSFTLSEAAPTVVPQPTQRVDDSSRRNIKQMKDLNEAPADIQAEYQQVLEAMEYEVEQGQVVVSIEGEKIVVEMVEDSANNPENSDPSLGKGGRISQQTLEIAQGVNEIASEIASEIVVKRQNQGLAKAEGQATEAASKYEAIRAELSEQIEQGLAEVERDGDSVIIRLGQQDSFSSGSAALQAGFEDTLIRVGDALGNVGGQVRVEGHTDNIPVAFSERFRSNWDLSSARSAAVANFLLDNSQLQPGRVTITGLADSDPIADNSTAAGRAQNRRIEVIVDG
ncbi:MAG: flagellar motor protein MotB [Pseudomonadota bacterium]|nr:flagellar motor protein MotB [Pseudomonadota bacterium]